MCNGHCDHVKARAALRLSDLNPRWLTFEPGRNGQGVSFDCPHCENKWPRRISIAFENPLDGKAPAKYRARYSTREGEDFESLTIKTLPTESTSVHWHGYIQNGYVVNA